MSIDSILSIDAATKLGWAFRETTGDICFDHILLGKPKTSEGFRLRMYRDWLDKTLSELQPSLVVYEMPTFGQMSGRLFLGGLYGVTLEFLDRSNIACLVLSPGTIKKYVTGSGRAKKPEVRDAVRAKGYAVETDDEADAVAALLTAMDRCEIDVPSKAPVAPIVEMKDVHAALRRVVAA